MCADEMLSTVAEMEATLNRARHALHCEIEDITEQWEALRNLGGQRCDYAAQLLSRLRPALDEIATFAGACSQQITAIVADPFGRNDQ